MTDKNFSKSIDSMRENEADLSRMFHHLFDCELHFETNSIVISFKRDEEPQIRNILRRAIQANVVKRIVYAPSTVSMVLNLEDAYNYFLK
ncbi:hypothetical protein [Methanobacterium paludis]|uniref:Uncharacterized protein n=1 Tax=Methanobacterium paludis (strain DSM 25820 / JCM 18151 / SWAN1) TaxID=868131 RepID=F6D4V3_METPW|nr:hypothetical protein [Methanobacterium paludis]AEG18162.1 hypothetical protein MSWAN_1144 [Methanobacterium paludis]